MTAYYNEFDPFAAAWLRNLIDAGHIAPGVVDERDIREVMPVDLRGFDQCHFFAGIGGWSYAARLAGWPDDRPLWTGSCPCQPFSAAGKGGGFADERHLWPAFHHLIRERGPGVVFGEQVASKDGLAWLDLVHTDMEAEGYAFGAVDLCAAGVGAPHIRQRLWWVADAEQCGNRRQAQPSDYRQQEADRSADWLSGYSGSFVRLADRGCEGRRQISPNAGRRDARGRAERLDERPEHGRAVGVADSAGGGWARVGGEPAHNQLVPDIEGDAGGMGHAERECPWRDPRAGAAAQGGTVVRAERDDAGPSGAAGVMGVAYGDGCGPRRSPLETARQRHPVVAANRQSAWTDLEWLACRDGKARPTQPGLFPLAHGVPNRVGTLRGAGNAIVPQVAAEVISAYMDCHG